MCLAIPMQIISINGHTARCVANGIHREVSLFLLQDTPPGVGDFVLVHVGYAIQRVDTTLAHQSRQLHDDMSNPDA